MRVILVGSAPRRQRLRTGLTDDIEVVGEALTLSDAQALGLDADAYLMAARGDGDDMPLVEPLTAREIQVLRLLSDGLPNKAIAARLGVSDETVKFHLSSIFGKLAATNRTDAVRQAIRRGLVPL